MIAKILSGINQRFDHADFARLLVRIAIGMLIFHGWHKLVAGTAGIQSMLVAHGIPAFVAHGVIVGEVVAPILIILGILCRPCALVVIGTMIVAWLLVALEKTFAVDQVGAWALESIAFYVFMSLVLLFLGCGKYSVISNPDWR